MVFAAAKLGLRFCEHPSFAAAGARPDAARAPWDGYSTRVLRFNPNSQGDGSPGAAARSGRVGIGDFVISIGGEDVEGVELEDVIARIKGAARPLVVGFHSWEGQPWVAREGRDDQARVHAPQPEPQPEPGEARPSSDDEDWEHEEEQEEEGSGYERQGFESPMGSGQVLF